MKRSILVIFTLCTLNVSVWSQAPKHELAYVANTTATPANCIEIPSKFANGKVYDEALLRSLKNKEVATVELWYTRFKASPTFDQVKLNETRVKQLQAAYPELRNPNIKWIWKEQTEADTRDEAARCFHGFRIFPSDDQPLWVNGYRVEDKSNPAERISVDNSKGTVYQAKSGTRIHIPANAVVDAAGKPVTGNYTIDYTEYRDPAQIAFSGLPMHFHEQDQEFAFNSAGMYEIRGYQNNEPLQLQEAITVDFNCTDQIRDLNFYELNDQTGNWLKRQPLDFNGSTKDQQEVKSGKIEKESPNTTFTQGIYITTVSDAGPEISYQTKGNNTVLTLSKTTWNVYQNLKKTDPDYIEKTVLQEDTTAQKIETSTADLNSLTTKIINQYSFEAVQLQLGGSMSLASGYQVSESQKELMESYQNYSNMMNGLRSPRFGVYNCDQQRRMGEVISLQPTYIDQATGKQIEKLYSACIIDRRVNASFSFSPTNISFGKSSPSEIILFTSDKNVYHVSSTSLKNLPENGGATELKMKDISAQVKTSEDLKKYLNL